MPLLLLLALLVLNSGPTYAEWVAVEKKYQPSGLQAVYIDPDTIRRAGNRAVLWQLTDYKWRQGNIIGSRRFVSTKTHKEFDCPGQRVRLLAFTDFLGHMGTGSAAAGYVDQDTWLPVERESLNHKLWEMACGKE